MASQRRSCVTLVSSSSILLLLWLVAAANQGVQAWTSLPSSTTRSSISRAIEPRSSSHVVVQSTSPQSSDQVRQQQQQQQPSFGTREEASRESPPSSFWELHPKSVRAVLAAMKDGHPLLEIEYPPLAANILEQDDVGAYDVARANFNLALDFSKSLRTTASVYQQDLPICILLPDDAELKIAIDNSRKANVNMMTGNPQEPYPGITISALRTTSKPGDGTSYDENIKDTRSFKPEQFLMSMFGGAGGGEVRAIPGVKVYVCIIASAQELPDIETLHQLAPDATIICFNLKLDVLRGDLGAPAFPPKAFQDRFLSRVKPVYYLRTRQYSRSVTRAPFIVSYQGCLFRSYPGDFQTLLDTGNGRYRRIASNSVRPALGAFKEELTQALREQGILEEENATLNFLRTGYKTTTWWEEDRGDASNHWKT